MRSGNNYQDKIFLHCFNTSLLRAHLWPSAIKLRVIPWCFFPLGSARITILFGSWYLAQSCPFFRSDPISICFHKHDCNVSLFVYIFECKVVVRLERLINFLQAHQKSLLSNSSLEHICPATHPRHAGCITLLHALGADPKYVTFWTKLIGYRAIE